MLLSDSNFALLIIFIIRSMSISASETISARSWSSLGLIKGNFAFGTFSKIKYKQDTEFSHKL